MTFTPSAMNASLQITATNLVGGGGATTVTANVPVTQTPLILLTPSPPNPGPTAHAACCYGSARGAGAGCRVSGRAKPHRATRRQAFSKFIPPGWRRRWRPFEPSTSILVIVAVGEPSFMALPATQSSPHTGGAAKVARDGDSLYASAAYSSWEDLDEVRDQLQSLVHSQMFVVGSALTVSTGLTVGYVMWMLRGGMLLSSLIAQIPAWSLIDPLVILSHMDDDEEDKRHDEDQESLETILASSENPSTYGEVLSI